MLKFNYIVLLISCCIKISTSFAQPILNERFGFDTARYVLFSSVISTDSCYYVNGMQTSAPGVINIKSSFTKFNFDGSISLRKEIYQDTMGIAFWFTTEMIQTLDGNFAQIALVSGELSNTAFMFIKLDPNGDTLKTQFLYDFYAERQEFGIKPYTLLQDVDSTYYGILLVQRESDLRAGVIFYKLDKNGALIFNTPLYPPADMAYHYLIPGSLIKQNDTVFTIGATLINVNTIENADERVHSKIINIHKNGTVLSEHTYWDDKFSADVNGLIKTNDGGLIYGGRNGKLNTINNGFKFVGRIVKLNADLAVDWEINLGDSTGFESIAINKILPISDTTYVAIGFMSARKILSNRNEYGWLIKFDIKGNIIWERRILKVTYIPGDANKPVHELYDAEITPDSGFVLVGQAMNFHENEFAHGQKGWLLKTDKHGCMVPGCQLYDTPTATTTTIETVDTTVINPPKIEPITWLYPNPTANSIFYYHHQNEFKGGTAYIYNSFGQMVQKWEITANNITYEIDVAHLAAGNYIIKVFNGLGEALATEQFIKIGG